VIQALIRFNTIFYHLVVAYFFGPPCISVNMLSTSGRNFRDVLWYYIRYELSKNSTRNVGRIVENELQNIKCYMPLCLSTGWSKNADAQIYFGDHFGNSTPILTIL